VVESLAPAGYMTTTFRTNVARKQMVIHQAKSLGALDSEKGCRTKLIGEVRGDIAKLFARWDQFGWHRVTSRNDPLRGYKGQMFEGGIRVPFVMQWKGKIPAGQTYREPVMGFDCHATALAAANVDVSLRETNSRSRSERATVDGANPLPFVTGQGKGRPHDQLFWRAGRQHAARVGDWKLVTIPQAGGSMLFNLKDDIAEQHDLAATNPDKLKELQAAFAEWERGTQPAKWIRQDQRNAESGGKLKAGGESSTPRRRTPAAGRIDEWDTNKDGVVTPDEVKAYYTKPLAGVGPEHYNDKVYVNTGAHGAREPLAATALQRREGCRVDRRARGSLRARHEAAPLDTQQPQLQERRRARSPLRSWQANQSCRGGHAVERQDRDVRRREGRPVSRPEPQDIAISPSQKGSTTVKTDSNQLTRREFLTTAAAFAGLPLIANAGEAARPRGSRISYHCNGEIHAGVPGQPTRQRLAGTAQIAGDRPRGDPLPDGNPREVRVEARNKGIGTSRLACRTCIAAVDSQATLEGKFGPAFSGGARAAGWMTLWTSSISRTCCSTGTRPNGDLDRSMISAASETWVQRIKSGTLNVADLDDLTDLDAEEVVDRLSEGREQLFILSQGILPALCRLLCAGIVHPFEHRVEYVLDFILSGKPAQLDLHAALRAPCVPIEGPRRKSAAAMLDHSLDGEIPDCVCQTAGDVDFRVDLDRHLTQAPSTPV
jgi:hypothetical protein